jgi:Na+/H+ antiporter NhaD/arsenite permease-like protein
MVGPPFSASDKRRGWGAAVLILGETMAHSSSPSRANYRVLSGPAFFIVCSVVALLISAFVRVPLPTGLLAFQVIAMVLGLFVFGSSRVRLDKTAFTFGAGLVVAATFFTAWFPGSALKQAWAADGFTALLPFLKHHLGFHGLNKLIHLDTMLFIFGLTFFVAVIAQTRLLETLSQMLLNRFKGWVLPTVAVLCAAVALASGILDGVSMIGLLIRTMVVILFWANIRDRSIDAAVMMATVVTTVCGMWLAYGEPPNLIMKSNLHPLLTDAFFLKYCAPAAAASFGVVLYELGKSLKGKRVEFERLDVLDRHTADVRFLQAKKHGEVPLAVEFADDHREMLGDHLPGVMKRLHAGVPLGEAMTLENVPRDTRVQLLGDYLTEELAPPLDDYYVHTFGNAIEHVDRATGLIDERLESIRRERKRAQIFAAVSFVPFLALLAAHAANHDVPLFLSSWAGFGVAFTAIVGKANIRRLALHEAGHESREYLFLIPLFFSISLLQKAGFFTHLVAGLQWGFEHLGLLPTVLGQFFATGALSALLDNNVVADFAGRALIGFEKSVIYLSAMAQIAGYAVGGCLTHIGSAQSVVAYAFIKKDVSADFTPVDWFKGMAPVVLKLTVLMAVIITLEVLL